MPATARKETRRRGAGERTLPFDHWPELLFAGYTWRYLTANHVHRLFAEHYGTATTTSAKRHLRQLAAAGYFKTTRPTQNHPKVYSTTAKARRELDSRFAGQAFLATREEATRPEQLNHELALSDLHTELHRAIAAHGDLAVASYQRRYFHRSEQLAYRNERGERRQLEPDLGVMLRITSDDRTYPQLHFWEMDLGTERPAAFTAKLLAYTGWYRQAGERYLVDRYRKLGDPDPQPSFRVLVVTQGRTGRDIDRLRRLYDQARGLPPTIRGRIWFTTAESAAGRNLLTDPIWHPVRQTNHRLRSLFRAADH